MQQKFLKNQLISMGNRQIISAVRKTKQSKKHRTTVKESETYNNESSNYANNIILRCRLFRLNSIIYQSTNEANCVTR